MGDFTKEKFGTVVYDGKVFDLDNMTSDEVNELQKKVEIELEKTKFKIINQLNNN